MESLSLKIVLKNTPQKMVLKSGRSLVKGSITWIFFFFNVSENLVLRDG